MRALLCIILWAASPAAPSPATSPAPSRPVCRHQSTAEAVVLADADDTVLPDGAVRCGAVDDYCFAYWRGGAEGGGVRVLAQGCFRASSACDRPTCMASRQEQAAYFCCCRGDLCNANVTVPSTLLRPAVVSPLQSASRPHRPVLPPGPSPALYWALFGSVCFVLLSVVLWLVAHQVMKSRRAKEKGAGPKGAGPVARPAHIIDIKNVLVGEIIGRGRFGVVHRASAGQLQLVVKLFADAEKESYDNELSMFLQPHMSHPNVLQCLGGGLLPSGHRGLVLEYVPRGRLSSHLARHCLSWRQLVHVMTGATAGLAHLHTPVARGGLHKPSMSHRDFNSRNIVLRHDLSCVVIDLGLAVCQGGGRGGAPPAISEAGTVRYMAPELLEGAVDLSESETALCQIDVYALGLVLWECVTRCDVIGAGQAYQPPYQALLGTPHATINQMMETVVRQKARPALPSLFNPAPPNPALSSPSPARTPPTPGPLPRPLRLLKETIEECWDTDADARLSAAGVLERLGRVASWDGNLEPHCGDESRALESSALLPGTNAAELPAYPDMYRHAGMYAASGTYSGSSSGPDGSRGTGSLATSYTMETMLSPSLSGVPLAVSTSGQREVSVVVCADKNTRHHVTKSDTGRVGKLWRRILSTLRKAPSSDPQRQQLCGPQLPVIVAGSNTKHGGTAALVANDYHANFANKYQASFTNKYEGAFVNKYEGSFANKLDSPFVNKLDTSFADNYVSPYANKLDPSFANKYDSSFPNDLEPSFGNKYDPSFELLEDLMAKHSICSDFDKPRLSGTLTSSTEWSNFTSSHGGSSSNSSKDSVVSKAKLSVSQSTGASVRSSSSDVEALRDVDPTEDREFQRSNTLPLRRVKSDKPRSCRPVSLEIRVSPEEGSSPLANYLSTSCNFKTPGEVVLSKSRTRVKTPRHPPLARYTHNTSLSEFNIRTDMSV